MEPSKTFVAWKVNFLLNRVWQQSTFDLDRLSVLGRRVNARFRLRGRAHIFNSVSPLPSTRAVHDTTWWASFTIFGCFFLLSKQREIFHFYWLVPTTDTTTATAATGDQLLNVTEPATQHKPADDFGSDHDDLTPEELPSLQQGSLNLQETTHPSRLNLTGYQFQVGSIQGIFQLIEIIWSTFCRHPIRASLFPGVCDET